MNGAPERTTASIATTSLELPCGHAVELPAGVSAPGLAVSVLGHQMTCSVGGREAADPSSEDPAEPIPSRRRPRRSDAAAQVATDRAAAIGRLP